MEGIKMPRLTSIGPPRPNETWLQSCVGRYGVRAVLVYTITLIWVAITTFAVWAYAFGGVFAVILVSLVLALFAGLCTNILLAAAGLK